MPKNPKPLNRFSQPGSSRHIASRRHSNASGKTTNLRIMSGKFKQTIIASPHSVQSHPMGAREKIALFNMLQPYLAEAKVLDAYAGSGALGIEALSRGAESVVFVEQSPGIAKVIQQNLAKLQLSIAVYSESAAKFASREQFHEYFDIVIADPPYDNFLPDEIVKLCQVLHPGGILALSHPELSEPLVFPECEQISSHRYAAAHLTLFRYQP